jgi:hypothetical protein
MRYFSLFLLFLMGSCLDIAHAETRTGNDVNSEASPVQNMLGEIADGFDARINVIGFGITQKIVDSGMNRGNVLEIPRHRAEVHLKPDFYLDFRCLEFSLKPRLELCWQKWENGVLDGESDTDEEGFVNEWLVRYRLRDQLFVSYGRENLQWGPSYLLSPSNPFNRDNGRNNPRLEVPGLDYGRAVLIPNSTWTASFIVNTDEGRQELIQDFEKTYAVKIDYTGEEKYFSLIASHQEGEDFRLGFFVGWTASDALLLYGEGSVSDEDDDARFLAGGSYTFEMGPTIALEFFRKQDGCTLEPIERCFGPEAAGDVDQADVLVRKNYVLLQYVHTHIRDSINLTLRWIHNFDDTSARTIGMFEYELNDHTQMFLIGNLFLGDEDTEFGCLLDYSLMAGMSYTF